MHGSTYSDFLCTCDKLFIFSSESPVFGFCISSNLLYLIKWLKKCSSASLKLSIFTFLVESLTWMHKHARKSSLMISQSSFPPFFCKYLKKPAISNFILSFPLSSVQFSRSVMSDSLWSHEPQHARPPCPSPIPGIHQIHVHWFSDAIQPSHPLSSPSPPAPIFHSIRAFSNESALCIKWSKYWSFSFNISWI